MLGQFKESKERLVRLPEADSDVFQVLLDWVYTKEITPGPEELKPKNKKVFNLLVRLYVLADQLDIHELRNTAIDSILTRR